jgi:hypothetical protein
MTPAAVSPRLVKAGLVLVDPQTLAPVRTGPVPGGVIAFQYNPETLTRTLQAVTAGGDGQDRSEALRLKAPPVETIKLDAELDATDELDKGTGVAAAAGVLPLLAALESLVYPTARQVAATRALAATGALEVLPMEAPLTLFVWGRTRVVPVRVTEFTATEEAFDAALNPVRAKVSLGLRVLTMYDLGFDHRGADLFTRYHQQKEALAGSAPRADLGSLGIGGLG